ncbi:MAG: sterol desaturase family protein, partial [Rhodanobacteraceae bacterium]|nr:sterol desaturase family protein [Rhodanobacteraceae bacterium]
MGDWLLAHEGQLRLGVFFGLFTVLAALQAWRPLRGVRAPWRRFGRHLLLALLGSALVRL